MPRSVKKGPFVDEHLLRKALDAARSIDTQPTLRRPGEVLAPGETVLAPERPPIRQQQTEVVAAALGYQVHVALLRGSQADAEAARQRVRESERRAGLPIVVHVKEREDNVSTFWRSGLPATIEVDGHSITIAVPE